MQQKSSKILIAATVPETVRLLMRGQLDWFANKGYLVDVCTDPGSNYGLGNAEFTDSVHERHFISMERDFSVIKDIGSLIQWVRLLRKTRPDYLVACTPKASLLSLIAGLIARVPNRIYILFGLRYETSTGIARKVLKATERICGYCADVVIAVSPSLANCATEEKLISSKKIRLIGKGSSNGVDSNRFKPLEKSERERKRASLGYSEDDFVVGFIGRLTPDKGIDSLLEAFGQVNQRVDHAKLLLIGPFEGSSIEHPGMQQVGSQADTSKWHPLLDALVLPTKREGFPNVVLEAHACAVPVITTRATGAVDSVIDGENGLLVDVDNVDQLAKAIMQLATNPGLCHELGANGRSWVIENFQPEFIWLGMDKIFHEMK